MNLHNAIISYELLGVHGAIGVIVLNRPHVLNAIDDTMVQHLAKKLRAWQAADHIHAICLRGVESSRGFCAGGDLRALQQLPHDEAIAVLRAEYQLISQLQQCTKLSLIHI